MSGVDVNRLRNWARGYQRLMLGGLGAEAHTVGVDEFADDEGNYPFITAADVLALLDERDALAAKVERVSALAEEWSAPESLRHSAWRRERDVADQIRATLNGDQP